MKNINKLAIYPEMFYITSIRVIKDINRFPKTLFYEDKYLSTCIITKLKKEKFKDGINNKKTIGFQDINNGHNYRYYLDKGIYYHYFNQELITSYIGLDSFICDEYCNKLFDINFLNYLAFKIINKIDSIDDFYRIMNYLKTEDLKIFNIEAVDNYFEEYNADSDFKMDRKLLKKTKEGIRYII